MASRRTKLILIWVGVALVFILVSVASVWRWMQMAADARQELLEHQRQAMSWDRAHLSDYWGEKLTWFPSAEAPTAMAVMPRSKFNDFDAIYALYEGDRAVAVLGLTQVGGYFDLERINAKEHPERLIARQLTPAELAGLRQLHATLADWLATLDPQSNRHGWTKNVVKIAAQLEARQGDAGDAAAIAPNPSGAGAVQ